MINDRIASGLAANDRKDAWNGRFLNDAVIPVRLVSLAFVIPRRRGVATRSDPFVKRYTQFHSNGLNKNKPL